MRLLKGKYSFKMLTKVEKIAIDLGFNCGMIRKIMSNHCYYYNGLTLKKVSYWQCSSLYHLNIDSRYLFF